MKSRWQWFCFFNFRSNTNFVWNIYFLEHSANFIWKCFVIQVNFRWLIRILEGNEFTADAGDAVSGPAQQCSIKSCTTRISAILRTKFSLEKDLFLYSFIHQYMYLIYLCIYTSFLNFDPRARALFVFLVLHLPWMSTKTAWSTRWVQLYPYLTQAMLYQFGTTFLVLLNYVLL